MPRVTKPTTNAEIEKAKPKDKEYTISDGSGLYLLIKPNGSKIWRFDYVHPQSKKRALMSFGSYPEITLAQAREMREDARRLVKQGISPKEDRDRQKSEQAEAIANTFESIAVKWFEHRKARANFGERHATQTWKRTERHLIPRFGSMPISQLTASFVINSLMPLHSAGALSELKRVIQILNEVFTYALHRDIVTFNPCQKISKEFDAPQIQHFPTIRPEELAQLLSKLSTLQNRPRQIILWQMYTMARPGEAITAKWEDIDFEAKTWTYYVQKGIKTDEKGRVHKVTLCNQAIQLLKEIQTTANPKSPYLFPGRKQGAPLGNSTANRYLSDHLGYKGKLVAHGIRSIASTYLNEQGYDKELVEIALSHIDRDRTRKAYNHGEYLERRAELLQIWGDFIERSFIA